MADGFIKFRKDINYVSYILANPLYIHNHERYFRQTIDNLKNMGVDSIDEAENLFYNYVELLKNREKDILETIGGEDSLKLMVEEAFTANENMKQILSILDKIFYMNQNTKVSITKKSNEEDVRYLRLTTGKSGKKRQDIINPIQLIIDKTNPTSVAHGRIINNYDYKASAKKLTPQMRQALLDIVREIQLAIGSQKSINNDIRELIDEGQLSKKISSRESPFYKYIREVMSFKARPSNEQLLKFIVDKMGTYSAIKGQFSEAAEIEFSAGIKDIFGENFSSRRGDIRNRTERNGSFKKPDLILSGGIINADLNPITVSMKTISGEKDIKVQNSPLMGGSGGIFQAFLKDSPNVAKLYLYLMLNNSYYENGKALEIINLLNRYMSYIFLSGTFKTEIGKQELPSNQALYLVLNQSIGDNIKISFIPISEILLAMKDGDIKITNTRKSTTNLSSLWSIKLRAVGYKKRNSKRLKNLTYENLHNKSLVIDKVKDVADSLLTRDRKIDIKYSVVNGIIS